MTDYYCRPHALMFLFLSENDTPSRSALLICLFQFQPIKFEEYLFMNMGILILPHAQFSTLGSTSAVP